MELWYTEQQTDEVRFSIKVKQHLYTGKSEFQDVDVFESEEFGKFLTLDGLMMVTEKDEFIYHDMITHVAMATNPSIKKVLVIGGGDGGTVRELTRYSHIEKIDMVLKHLNYLSELKSEKLACLEIRNHIAWYLKGIDGANDVKNKVYKTTKVCDIINILNEFREELSSKYEEKE